MQMICDLVHELLRDGICSVILLLFGILTCLEKILNCWPALDGLSLGKVFQNVGCCVLHCSVCICAGPNLVPVLANCSQDLLV